MRIALISARYGQDIGGGAEYLAYGLMRELSKRGHFTEVWTTCARDNQTWENYYSPGASEWEGVTVRRFLVDSWQNDSFENLTAILLKHGGGSIKEQIEWIEKGPSSQDLLAHTAKNQQNFDLVVAIPAISTLVYKAALLALDRLIIWPCLHDEIFAYLRPVRYLMEGAKGIIFNSPEERYLAIDRLKMKLKKTTVTGSGVEIIDSIQEKIISDPPYILYVGRLEEGKNLPLLIEFSTRYAEEEMPLMLKVAGRGSYFLAEHPAVEFLGFITDKEKTQLYRNALALCQPSVNESFSLTMMESWLTGRPVLVHKKCAVTTGHVQRAKGGLWFETYGEFRGAVNWFVNNTLLSAKMGENGRVYVRSNYTWPVVADRFLSAVTQWQKEW